MFLNARECACKFVWLRELCVTSPFSPPHEKNTTKCLSGTGRQRSSVALPSFMKREISEWFLVIIIINFPLNFSESECLSFKILEIWCLSAKMNLKKKEQNFLFSKSTFEWIMRAKCNWTNRFSLTFQTHRLSLRIGRKKVQNQQYNIFALPPWKQHQ